ncbi:hypothetical protein L0663_08650 [Dyadobacter sp. CY107]|uniref:hypothetical protein n=1 Tax=Dyadobacter fanqingshengii TaxID=2906443 RepID=UPI001F1F2F87|nr:hypothetical protein [Dyadobacter fanqingshengii]MCF2503441.1 hypothetical protein [Dyadobacter fanqingshengii]
MKLLHNAPAITKALILAGFVSACQNEKDAIVSPATSHEQASDANAKTVVTKLLVKDGDANLSYSGVRNVFTKEVVNSKYSKEYAYSGNKIIGTYTNLANYNKINSYDTYTLNAKGLCVESAIMPTLEFTTVYVYNEMNQLLLAYNKNKPNQRQEYQYEMDPDGQGSSLYSVTFYDKNDVLLKELHFKYVDGTDGGYSSFDWFPVNPEHLAQATNKYLPIFGKFSRFLLKQTIEKTYYIPNGVPAEKVYNYTYALNNDGSSAIKSITTKDSWGKTISLIERKYTTPTGL